MTAPHEISTIAVVGTGVIGSSWASLFLAAGHSVVACDPSPGAKDRLARDIEANWASLVRQGAVVEGASPDSWTFVDGEAAAVEGADFVQENGPERIEIKNSLYETMDAIAGPNVILASSSSGLKASDIQAACTKHPERVVIGHPFNPPHLIPLVEVVGGAATSEDSIASAMAFYRDVGKSPIHIRAELPGHVTNRLQAALWREAYWLVEQGVASVSDIDQAIANGPGLRWALLGPFATQSLSGGEAGIAHVLEHLGPPMVEWWKGFETPELSAELSQRVVEGVDEALAGIDKQAMVADRDRLLESLVVAKAEAQHLPRNEQA